MPRGRFPLAELHPGFRAPSPTVTRARSRMHVTRGPGRGGRAVTPLPGPSPGAPSSGLDPVRPRLWSVEAVQAAREGRDSRIDSSTRSPKPTSRRSRPASCAASIRVSTVLAVRMRTPHGDRGPRRPGAAGRARLPSPSITYAACALSSAATGGRSASEVSRPPIPEDLVLVPIAPRRSNRLVPLAPHERPRSPPVRALADSANELTALSQLRKAPVRP